MTSINPYISNAIIQFKTGALTLEQVEAIFSIIPFEIDFIDENNKFIYFSDHSSRIHKRSNEQLGSTLSELHPKNLLPKVNQMVEALRNGRQDKFEIVSGNHHTYNGYFAVRDSAGSYLGTLVVTSQLDYFQNLIESNDPASQTASLDSSTNPETTYNPDDFVAPKYDKSSNQQNHTKESQTSKQKLSKDVSTGASDSWLS